MESFELNKILGAVLGTSLVLMVVHLSAAAIFTPRIPAKPGFVIAAKEREASAPAAQAKPAPEQPIDNLLASADIDQGKTISKICMACHTLQKGEPNKIGPNLWGVVGRPRASEPGYDYSSAMKAKGGTWSYDELNNFLAGPGKYIPGTKMTFAGLDSEHQRADIIGYLRTLSDHPQPLPNAAAPADGSSPAQNQSEQNPKPDQPSPPAGKTAG